MYLTKYLVKHKLDDHQTIVLNTLTGAIDLIDNEFMRYFESPETISPSAPIYQSLLDRGYIYNSKAEEEAKLKALFEKFKGVDRPVMFVICPTYACNLRCVYCFEGDLTQVETHALTVAEVDSIFRAIEALTDKPASIQLFGGEPFLPANRAIISYILDEARKREFTISAVTNGVNLKEFLPLLRPYRDHLIDFQITLDGTADIHDKRRPKAGGQGTFVDIVSSIDDALAQGIRVRVRVNVDRENIGSLTDLANFMIQRGWDKFENFAALLSPVDNHTGETVPHRLSEDETAKIWLDLKKNFPEVEIFRPDLFRNLDYIISTLKSDQISYPRFFYCESNNLSCYTFGTDKNIYLCAEAIGDQRTAVGSYHPDLVLDQKALDKWDGRSIMTLKKCRDCAVATFCGGGCAYAAMCINGSIDDPHCNQAEETLHAYLESIKGDLLAL